MSRLKEKKASWPYTFMLYGCGLLLFLEWLYPVPDVTYTSGLTVFIIYALFCFMISMLRMKWWIECLLKGFGLLFALNGLFIDSTFLTGIWFQALYMDLSYNLEAILAQQWYNMTPLFRSFLFLLLIGLMSYLLHYWFVVMKRIFLFVLLTFIYLAVLDTFTVYDGDMAMVRTFIISFIALGIANVMKELDKESIDFSWIKKTPIWAIPLVVTVLIASLIGYAAPKLEPQWPDPVPFIQSTAENAGYHGAGGGSVQKVGYGEDDSRLGGSFVQDYTPVFEASVSEEHYWRIETKDVYTGEGWENAEDPDYLSQNAGEISLETFDTDAVETESLEAMVDFQEDTAIDKLIYPYGTHHVYATGAQYLMDPHSEAIETRINDEPANLDNYTISYDHPSFAIDELQETGNDDPEDIQERHTQLPSSLPDRVGELAEEITATYDDRYGKAKAVERYFGQNGFEYQTTDVPVPEEDEDYVDQFLFDSQVGYCDNYSTSMVVLLRTLDIPARWAKGFTSGEMIESSADDSTDVYEVTNANAHSWVEVYFPDVGWVPFEPTQGFSNLSDFHRNMDDASGENQDDVMDQTPETEENEPEPELPEEEEETQPAMAEDTTDDASSTFHWWYVSGMVVILIIVGTVMYKKRLRWQTYLLGKRLEKRQNVKTYQEAYHHLLRVLQHVGLEKEPDQTLREYAKHMDARYETDEMTQLTAYYEQVLYNNKADTRSMQQLTQLWKNLIKRIMG
ncbi:transglutaminase domain-containing protein [Virgibacillus sp. NKC19-3]|uniref:DUF4129 domain-containing transglutaminase family protein n=1 Tax=Virgibacillus saliphilus TaxID=2831674 RepID=UPI001C9B265B|nr:transglutaminase domain-containing protein [Virgibacillus sp. NKC19-3]MBY7142525.1 transglutaminase domain-containing protein [Virgibacillus sp. NKC19-3]